MALMERILEPYVVTPPAVEPLSLSEVMTHLRVDSTDEDTYLIMMIRATRERTEAYVNRALVTQTLEVSLDGWWTGMVRPPWTIPALPLPRPPLQSISSVKYTDDAGVEATWASGNYFADTRSTPGLVVIKRTAVLPSVNLKESGGIVVRYVAGYGSATAVPDDIKWAMLLWIGELYQNRENVAPPGGLTTIPSAAYRLLDKYRVN